MPRSNLLSRPARVLQLEPLGLFYGNDFRFLRMIDSEAHMRAIDVDHRDRVFTKLNDVTDRQLKLMFVHLCPSVRRNHVWVRWRSRPPARIVRDYTNSIHIPQIEIRSIFCRVETAQLGADREERQRRSKTSG